jgi:hypothetical protein
LILAETPENLESYYLLESSAQEKELQKVNRGPKNKVATVNLDKRAGNGEERQPTDNLSNASQRSSGDRKVINLNDLRNYFEEE